METTLHRQLKDLYASDPSRQEVAIDGYRIDVVADDRLIEIQYGSLGAIRDKIKALLANHDVLVVKPLAARKYLIKRKRKGGRIASSRYSPTRETVYHLFDDLVHFTNVFGHPRLTLEILLTEQEEDRVVANKRRWRSKDYRVEDRRLRQINQRVLLRTPADLIALIPKGLPKSFSTADLARQANIPRWLARKMAYCLKKTGAARAVARQGNAVLYRIVTRRRAAA